MTRDSQKDLLKAYRVAIAGKQDGIADLLEKLILDEMGSSAVSVPVTRGVKIGPREDNPIMPPWHATCGPDAMPLTGKEETI